MAGGGTGVLALPGVRYGGITAGRGGVHCDVTVVAGKKQKVIVYYKKRQQLQNETPILNSFPFFRGENLQLAVFKEKIN